MANANLNTNPVPTAFQAYCQAANPFTKLGLAVHLPSGGGSVTFGAYPSGGQSPFTYNWGDGNYVVFNEYTTSYTQPVTQGPSVVVKDANNQISPAIQCPSVVVGDGTPGTNPLPSGAFKLLIGSSGTNLPDGDYDDTKSTHKSYQVVQGSPFAFKWNMNLPGGPTGYITCINQSSPSGSFALWDSYSLFNSGAEQHTVLNVNNTSSVPTGDYTFRTTCSKADFTTITSSVKLRVIKSSIIHF
jgi:hypothetical protein